MRIDAGGKVQISSFWALLFNPVAQAKFVHTVGAGYVTGTLFVLSISAYYLLKGRHKALAQRSVIVASAFGLASSLCVIVLGDESGYNVSENQKMKLATIEGMWKTEPAPASLTIFGIPDSEKKEMRYEVKVPWVLGLIATRSFSEKMPGIDELVARAEARIKNGLTAYDALERLKTNRNDRTAREQLSAAGGDLGYALLLKRYVGDPRKADAATIAKAAGDTAPSVAPLFWAFRIMVALGFYFVFLTGAAFWFASHRDFSRGWLQHLTGLGDSPPNSGSDLAVKGILYVIMTPPNAD